MDIRAAWDEIVRITFSASTVAEGMSALIDLTAQAEPSAKWDELRSLDYEGDALTLRGWLAGVLAAEPPASDVKAYWFGVFNPVVDDEASCEFYVSGATEDYTPDTLDWACWTEETYLPQDRYAPSQVLPALYRTAQGVEDAELLGEYTLCLGYVCLVVMAMARSLEPRLFLSGAAPRRIAVGFDAGDGLLLGTVRQTGWSPADPLAAG